MRILEVCCDLDGGGSDRYVYNYCTRIHDIHFDYSAVDNRRGILEPLLEAEGSNVYHVPQIKRNPIKYYKSIKAVMQNGNYDGVHVHLGHKSFLALIAAKKCGIQARIVHAHIAFVPENIVQTIIRKISTVITVKNATHLAACGSDAAKWVWGEEAYNSGKVKVINNAIETKKFSFSSEMREKLRKQFGIKDNQIVIGHVGRLSDQKNQLRLLDIFVSILRKKPDAKLVMVGQGEMEEAVKSRIQDLGIVESVLMLGIRNDVPDLLNMFDVFVFPSKYEGLPFTLIETQCNGLRCICSNSVTPLVKITNAMRFLSLADNDDHWADMAIEEAGKEHDYTAKELVIEAGYDIDNEAEKLGEFYASAVSTERSI